MQTASELKIRQWNNLSLVGAVACLFLIVDGALPQLQMLLLAGELLTGALPKLAFFLCLALGAFLRPRINLSGFPITAWSVFLTYLVFELGYFFFELNLPLGTIVQSFNGYYLTYLIAPAVLLFRGTVARRVSVRWLVWTFLVCAVIGTAQNLTRSPIIYTESNDLRFQVMSWEFYGEIRAFSLFSSGMYFGLFCSFCGAMGVALCRTLPWRGTALVVLSAVACYATMTRASYLTFFCACFYSAIITFGRKPGRGLWAPALFVVLGLSTLVTGIWSYEVDPTNMLRNSYSLVERASSWTYYAQLLARSSPLEQAFGLGLYPEKALDSEVLPLPVDNMPLAVTLHTGLVGLVIFGTLLVKMWLYLRQRALDGQSPLVVAAVSVWAILATVGIFNSAFLIFGWVFCLAVFCEKENARETQAPVHNHTHDSTDEPMSRALDDALATQHDFS